MASFVGIMERKMKAGRGDEARGDGLKKDEPENDKTKR